MIKKYEKRAIFPRRLMEFLTIPHAYRERERERERDRERGARKSGCLRGR